MSFKVGDRVILAKWGSNNVDRLKVGDTGRVLRLTPFSVEFDRYIHGDTADGLGKDGYCLDFYFPELIHCFKLDSFYLLKQIRKELE